MYFTLFQNIIKCIPVYDTCTPVQLMCFFFSSKVSDFFNLLYFGEGILSVVADVQCFLLLKPEKKWGFVKIQNWPHLLSNVGLVVKI